MLSRILPSCVLICGLMCVTAAQEGSDPAAPKPAAADNLQNQQDQAAAEPTLENLQQMYLAYLKGEGYPAEIDDDGTIIFKKEGGTYLLPVPQIVKDNNYFTLVYPGFWKVEDGDRTRALEAVNTATADTKVGKVYLVRGNAWATAEVFVAQPAQFEGVFERCMACITHARQKFIAEMRKEAAPE
ncbi:MAG: hypothetical protein KDA79_04260 [Planctomycetaceae bacterium]|nr:hypothetical protein [Planctomycetaceae bacterium]